MRIGSLFSGYGGLDQAVAEYTGASTAWVSDIDKGACKVLAHRYPNAPNIGDITQVDWTQVEPVDILTGGFPCQDVSHAGKRAGIRPDTRSGLWTQMAYAIDQLKPRLVVIENVRGLLSASAHSDLEPCPWCVGDRPDTSLRALGAVLGGLADIGYDARWCGLRAADIGAPHGRFRVFIVAYPAGVRLERPEPERVGVPVGQLTIDSDSEPLELLPTPAVNDMGAGKTVDAWDAWDAWTDDMRTKHGNGNGHGKSLSIEVQRLLPTPVAAEGTKPSNRMGVERRAETGQVFLTNVVVSQFGDDPTETTKMGSHGSWGEYGAAIERWENLTRTVPSPTMVSKKGTPKLSHYFDEWMMGLPAGWLTDVPDVSWNEALKLCGNGVVPQQALAALRRLLG